MTAFSSPPSWNIKYSNGFLSLGPNLTVSIDGEILVASGAGGTVTAITAGTGLTGGTINSSGTIALRPPTGSAIGGVKAGGNIFIAADGTISAVLPSGTGTVTGVFSGTGLSGGGVSGGVTLSLNQATTTALGGIVVGSTLVSGPGGLVNAPSGTTTAVGQVRLATNAETIAGSSSVIAVTPQGLANKVASTSAFGITVLSNSVTSPSTTQAATSAAVKTVNDLVTTAQATADVALPLAGGTMTGSIVFAPSQTFSGVGLPVATTTSPGVIIPSTGLAISPSGYLTTTNNGTVTSVTSGIGLGSPATGNAITSSGTINLLAATNSVIGGVKPGSNLTVALDGTLNVGDVLLTNRPYAYNSYVWPLEITPGQAPGANGSFLKLVDNITGEVAWSSVGMLNSVTAGTGLTATTTNGIATVSLTPIPSITPGNVGGTALIPTLAINAYGQVVSSGLANPFAPFQIPSVTAPFVLLMDFAGNNTSWAWTTNGNTTIENPLNAVSGQTGSLLITQNSLATYTITWGNSWKFGNFSPFAGAGLAEVTLLKFTVVAANYIVVDTIVPNIG